MYYQDTSLASRFPARARAMVPALPRPSRAPLRHAVPNKQHPLPPQPGIYVQMSMVMFNDISDTEPPTSFCSECSLMSFDRAPAPGTPAFSECSLMSFDGVSVQADCDMSDD